MLSPLVRSDLNTDPRAMLSNKRSALLLTCILMLASAGVQSAAAQTALSGSESPADVSHDRVYECDELSQLPSLSNRNAIVRLLVREYPEALRQRGIGGRAVMTLVVRADGTVEAATVEKPSGHFALDRAAHSVAMQMRFKPGRLEGEAVRTRIAVPVNFQVRGPAADFAAQPAARRP